MKRFHDWQLKLEQFVASRYRTPFTWGTNDCATFAADAVLALTGVDPAPTGMRGHTTAKQAYRLIKRHGGLANIATKALGEPIPSAYARVGDVVLTLAGKREMLAICNGAGALAPSASGLVTVPLGSWCWRII